MKTLILVYISLLGFSGFAGQLPTWVEQQSKLQAYEQLAEWSTETQPYKIQSTRIQEEKNMNGELTQKVEIGLESLDCKKQKLATTCLPVGLHTPSPALFCNMTLIDCGGKKISKMKLVK